MSEQLPWSDFSIYLELTVPALKAAYDRFLVEDDPGQCLRLAQEIQRLGRKVSRECEMVIYCAGEAYAKKRKYG